MCRRREHWPNVILNALAQDREGRQAAPHGLWPGLVAALAAHVLGCPLRSGQRVVDRRQLLARLFHRAAGRLLRLGATARAFTDAPITAVAGWAWSSSQAA